MDSLTTSAGERATILHTGSSAHLEDQDGVRPVANLGSPARQRRRWGTPIGWLLSIVLVGSTVVVLTYFEVPWRMSAVFVAYLVGGITVPGTLLWRLASRRPGPLVEDLAAGTALGYALEVLTYLPARAAGQPLLVLIWSVATVLVFLAVPRLRRHWRAGSTERPPVWWSSTMALLVGFLVAWSSLAFFRSTHVSSPGYTVMDFDMPYHLALIGEAKHHMPPTVPWLAGEPLYYHWFVYAEMAATSWVTGIEPQVLLYRLAPLPMLAAFAVLIAALTRRLTGNWWSGLVATAMTFLALAPNPYGWPLGVFFRTYGFGAVEDGSLLRPTMWISPTQTFGGLLCVPLVLVLVDLLRDPRRGWGRWALVAVLLCTVMGAKATYLPLLLGGVTLVLVVRLLLRRRPPYAALVFGAMVVGCLIFAQVVLFGRASQGLIWAPLTTMKWAGLAVSSQFIAGEPPAWRLAVVTALFVVCWTFIWSGALGLLRRRQLVAPPMLLLAGMGLAGIGALSAFGHPGSSQFFFFESARPYLAILATCGLSVLVGVGRSSWRLGLAMLAATGVGVAIVWYLRIRTGAAVPSLASSGGDPHQLAFTLVWPYLVLVGAVLLAAGVLALLRWKLAVFRGRSLALLIAVMVGFSLPSAWDQIALQALPDPNGWRTAVIADQDITIGTLEAGRWLRDHSRVDDLVATNAHCRLPNIRPCVGFHFTVAGFSERRVLVESWSATSTLAAKAVSEHLSAALVPFWNPELLADNDAAFKTPSARTIGRLKNVYGVRWLFVDEDHSKPAKTLGSFATLRFRSGHCAIYELTR